MIKKRVPVFLVGAMLGVAFAVVYLQGRHTMREAQKRPLAVNSGAPVTIKVQFDAPWQVTKHPQNKMELIEEGEFNRKVLHEWTEKEILGNILQTPRLSEGAKYRLQGFLQMCENGDSERCAPYYADIALEAQKTADVTEIILPYLPRLNR